MGEAAAVAEKQQPDSMLNGEHKNHDSVMFLFLLHLTSRTATEWWAGRAPPSPGTNQPRNDACARPSLYCYYHFYCRMA